MKAPFLATLKKRSFSLNLFLVILFLSTAVGSLAGLKLLQRPKTSSYILINQQRIFVEVAKTSLERSRGLSGREPLAENEGMLFIMPQVCRCPFWMKAMKFSLDFVFIKGDKVVEIIENVPFPKAGETPQTAKPQAEYDKILEINAGIVKEIKVKVGDEVSFFID